MDQSPKAGSEAPRPNLLVIMTDQQNVDAISAYKDHFSHPAYGGPWVETPHLDDLASRGVSFIESHTPNPICSPSRSCFFTGRYSTETGVIRNGGGIDRDVPNMGQWFGQQSDYRRVYAGKWHLGGTGYPAVEGEHKTPGFEVLPVGNPLGGIGVIADEQVSSGMEGFVRNYDGEEPFLAVASIVNPHDICFWGLDDMTASTDTFGLGEKLPPVPPNNADTYDAFHAQAEQVQNVRALGGGSRNFSEMEWRNYIYDYYRLVEKIDMHVGRLLSAVESRADETLIVFTSDHGEGLGRHSTIGKWQPYEESVKVPLIISGPGRLREGAVDTTHLVSNVDVMPTLCDYAGIPAPPEARGRSLQPLLEGGSPQEGSPQEGWREHVYAEWQYTGRLVRTERFKYVKFYTFSGERARPFVRETDGSAVAFQPGQEESYREEPVKLLFDLEEDPWEKRNLYGDPAYTEVVAEHERILREEYYEQLIPGTSSRR